MLAYRLHLRRKNRALAEEYIRQHRQHVLRVIEELAEAVPVSLAIAQLHQAIRRSPARNFWPVIRETKGVLLVRSTDSGQERLGPWKRTKRGNLRYKLPGHLLFSPWPPNFHRMLRSCLFELRKVTASIDAPASKDDFSATRVPYSIWLATLRAKHLVPKIEAFQGFSTPDSVAALDRWSDEPQRGSNIALRILQGTLVYDDGQDRCEIEVPDALAKPLAVPWAPERALELHLVRAGEQSFYP
jgi:hypothetical protein